MAESEPIELQIARQVLADERALAPMLARAETPRYGSKTVTPEQELALWEYADPSVDVDALRVEGLNDRTMKLLQDVGVDTAKFDMQAYEKGRAAGAQDETWIAALKYPHRMRLAGSAGRVLDQESQVKYVAHMHKRSADTAAEQQAERDQQGSAAVDALMGAQGAARPGGY